MIFIDNQRDMQNRLASNHFLVFILAFGVFGIINTEMGVVGIIPQIAQRFDVSIPTAGWTVSVFALIVSVSAPILPMIFSGVDRKRIMVITLSIFSLSNTIALWTDSFGILLFARALPAFFHPVYVAMAFTLAAHSTKEDPSRGIAKIFVGVSAGMVLGVPFTSFITTHLSFECAMGLFAVINLLTLLATFALVPSMPAKRSSFGAQVKILRSRLLWYSVAAFMLINGAMFGFFSFMSDFLHRVTGLNSDWISTVLLIYGITNIFGNMLAGRFFGSHRKICTLMIVPIMLSFYCALFLLGSDPWLCAGIIFILGVLAGFSSIVGQYLIASAAHNAPDFANGLFLATANFGTAFGTFLCGLFISFGNTQHALFGTLILLLMSGILIALRLKLAPMKQLN